MARPLRIEYPGAVYHVTSRGNARADIFLGDGDRQTFLNVLADTIEKYNWLCHAFCLLDNHYHAIIETLDPNLSMGMRQLNGVYTQAFNRSHKRIGHVFQGRYKAILVEKGSHLLELCRYVVLNPVRAGMAATPGQWQWSSYKSTAHAGKVPQYLTVDWVLGQFARNRTTARQRYREFVADGLKNPVSPWKKLTGQVFLGSENFVACMRELVGDSEKIREIPRAQRYPGRPPLDQLFADITGGDRQRRNNRIMQAHITHGYTLKEIADCLDIHYTTVSKIVAAERKN
ncbi:transposase [Desulfoferrobacter suflitae]|uniref:transposase n=1 Tax=Desulfoferrobacter suflitae TaxID=2865782 RepID=UPI002164DE26|nr:transposase [Desulfoferrobacter suflitae]MCK8603437.1 transposase [Desulfoferrobacter suflitae]